MNIVQRYGLFCPVADLQQLPQAVGDKRPAAAGGRSELSRALGEVDLKDEKSVSKEIRETEKKMLECARDLDFERAALYRDRLEALKRAVFGADGRGGDVL